MIAHVEYVKRLDATIEQAWPINPGPSGSAAAASSPLLKLASIASSIRATPRLDSSMRTIADRKDFARMSRQADHMDNRWIARPEQRTHRKTQVSDATFGT